MESRVIAGSLGDPAGNIISFVDVLGSTNPGYSALV